MYSLLTQVARSLKLRCRQGWILPRALRESWSHVSVSSCWMPAILGLPWLVNASHSSHMTFSPLPSSASYKDILIGFLGDLLNPVWPHLNPYLHHIFEDPTFREGLRLQVGINLGKCTVQPTAPTLLGLPRKMKYIETGYVCMEKESEDDIHYRDWLT